MAPLIESKCNTLYEQIEAISSSGNSVDIWKWVLSSHVFFVPLFLSLPLPFHSSPFSVCLSVCFFLSYSIFIPFTFILSFLSVSLRLFGQFTMEGILAAAFGCQVSVMKGEADSLTKAAGSIFSAGKRPITNQEIVVTATCKWGENELHLVD